MARDASYVDSKYVGKTHLLCNKRPVDISSNLPSICHRVKRNDLSVLQSVPQVSTHKNSLTSVSQSKVAVCMFFTFSCWFIIALRNNEGKETGRPYV